MNGATFSILGLGGLLVLFLALSTRKKVVTSAPSVKVGIASIAVGIIAAVSMLLLLSPSFHHVYLAVSLAFFPVFWGVTQVVAGIRSSHR